MAKKKNQKVVPSRKQDIQRPSGTMARKKSRVKIKPTLVKSTLNSKPGKKNKKKNTDKKNKHHKGASNKKHRKQRRKKQNKRKDTIADRAYEEYLQKMNVGANSKISIAEMNNVVREKIDMEVRYESELPALFSNILLSAASIGDTDPSNVIVERFITSPFGASFAIQNNGSGDVYLSRDGEAIFNINGGVLVKEESSVTVSLPSKSNRGGESSVDFNSNWIQSRAEARSLAQWVLTNQSDGGEEYSIEIFGNPYLDVGDIVILEYGKLNLNDSLRFIITSVNHDFDGGLKTTINVRRIYPNAAKMFSHTQGISQAPEGQSLLNE